MATIPVNISANVGIASGAPNSTETTAQYLTQLQQSLNGFTGSTAAALNYLISTVASAPAEKIVQVSALTAPSAGFLLNGVSGYVMGAMSTSPFVPANGGGTPPMNFTPLVTGRVAVIAFMEWITGMSNPGQSGSVNAILNFGTGSTSYVQGTAGPTGTQVGLGSILEQTIGDTNVELFNTSLAPMALLSGLSIGTQYWIDVGFSYSSGSSNAGQIITGTLFVIEC